MRKVYCIGAATALALVLTGCDRQSDSNKPVTELRYQGGVGTVSLPELAEDLGYFKKVKLHYVGNVQGGPQDLQTLAINDVDFAMAFNGAIVKFIAAGIKAKAVASTYGSNADFFVGYYTTADSPIKTARDLIGKKVGVNTLGAHFEFALKDYLAKGGLTPEEIKTVELVALPPVNTEQALRAGQIDLASLQGILQDKAVARGGVKKLFGDTDLYGNFTAGNYVFTEKFIQQHPEAVQDFVNATAKATEWTKQTPRAEVIERLGSIIKKRGRNEDASLVQYWRGYGVAETGGVITTQQYQPWIDWLVKDGQLKPNQIKAEQLFTNQFNPYATAKGTAVGESP